MCVFARFPVVVGLMLCISGFSEALMARPAIVHEQDRVAIPDPYYPSPLDVCLLGDDLLVLTARPEDEPRGVDAWAVVHFARTTGGDWQFVAELAAVLYSTFSDIWLNPQIDCEGSIGGFSAPGFMEAKAFILERTASGWTAIEVPHLASDVAVQGDTVAFGVETPDSPTAVAVYRKDAAGAWTDVRFAVGHAGDRSDFAEIVGPIAVEVASAELVATGDDYRPGGPTNDTVSDLQVFDLINGSWRLTATLPMVQFPIRQPLPVGTVGDRVALLMDVWTEPGDVGSFFTRDASGAWTVKHTLLSEEMGVRAGNVVIEGARAFVGGFSDVGEINVFREEAPRRYRHEATLIPSDRLSSPFGVASDFSVDGEWVALVTRFQPNVYVFHVPSTLPTPQRLEETFEDNMAQGWSIWGTTADWRIVSVGGSRVYQQRSTQAGSRSILESFEGTDQSIQADVRIRSGAGPAPWAGLVVRYTDTQNFYYLLVDSQSVQIRRMVGGAFGPIAIAPFNLVLGRTYRFRLEAIGSRLRAFVNDGLVAEVIDEAHTHGRAGLATWRAVTEYDNVVVSSSPHAELFGDLFTNENPSWSSTPSSAWSFVRVNGGTEGVYRQSRVTGSTHAIQVGPAEDQIVMADIQPREFNASGRGSVGLILRYVDNRNFYYARLTDANRVILGMQANGLHRTIDTATLTVNPNTTYTVRAEAIGSSLRVYVNGSLVAEGQDSTFSSGRYGLVTFEAAADFDNFKTVRP